MTSKHISTLKPQSDAHPSGVYVTARELVSYQHKATGFTFLPKQPVHSLLNGRHASRLRGRGLNFEEIRQYRMGDDIRSMDWRVTARLQKPHVRVYSEERDRPVYFVVDQRISMFFGSVLNMKSVTAAQAAALGVWRAFSLGDRIGGCVFGDEKITHAKPRHNQNGVFSFLNQIVNANQTLNAEQKNPANLSQLNQALVIAQQQLKHDGLCCVISDGLGFNEDTKAVLAGIAAKNDVLWGQISDPLEQRLPSKGQLIASDGRGQLHVPLHNKKFQTRFHKQAMQNREQLKQNLKMLNIPVLWLSTDKAVETQIRAQLGYSPVTRHR